MFFSELIFAGWTRCFSDFVFDFGTVIMTVIMIVVVMIVVVVVVAASWKTEMHL